MTLQSMPKDHRAYMPGSAGPFQCRHCEYYGAERCVEPHIVQFASEGRFGLKLSGDRAMVDPDGCSDYFEPK